MKDVTKNACHLCAPLGASLVYKGIKNCVTILHGSQGCATYIRRYMIGHYREPVDIASSSFTEHTAVFGGQENLLKSIENVIQTYDPDIIGIATTCLSETIGDDISMIIKEYQKRNMERTRPVILYTSTPSYRGTHVTGFFKTIHDVVTQTSKQAVTNAGQINIFNGLFSPAEIRVIRTIVSDFSLFPVIFPDYSDTLDGGSWNQYHPVPPGGTSLKKLSSCGNSAASIDFSFCQKDELSAGMFLKEKFDIPCFKNAYPIGIELCDNFFKTLSTLSQKPVPEIYTQQRERLIDAYVDSHKYLYGQKAVVFGEENLVYSICTFLAETGINVVCAATGGPAGSISGLKLNDYFNQTSILEDCDYEDIEEWVIHNETDILIGSSRGNKIAKLSGKPLIRCGFPIHDRIGASRQEFLGYNGTHNLFDQITNTIIERMQNSMPANYATM
ncbi:MAG: nitrogenase [Spirochaetes bacterium]|nr:nitrogenase [Spirochaetota bacterium]MBN2771908.1 nitrogenase [Spirochaetota bacterium]